MGFHQRPCDGAGPRRVARSRALLSAALTLGDGAQVYGRLRTARAAAARSNRGAGGSAPARRMISDTPLLAGEMHYPRIPRAYWEARLKMAYAMGLDAVSTYVFWNLHEPSAGCVRFLRRERRRGVRADRRASRACTSFCGRDRTSAPSGISAVFRRGCSPANRSRCGRRMKRYMSPVRRWLKRLGRGTRAAAAFARRADPGRAARKRIRRIRRRASRISKRCATRSDDAGFAASPYYTIDQPGDLERGSLPGVADRRNLRSRRSRARPRDAARAASGRTADLRRVLGGLVRPLGGAASAHRSREPGARLEMDARTRLLGKHLHVSRRHELRVLERREFAPIRCRINPTRPATTTTPRSTKPGARRRSIEPFATSSRANAAWIRDRSPNSRVRWRSLRSN